MKSPFNDEKFINRRNFWDEQAPSAELIYNYAVYTQRSTADSKGNQAQRMTQTMLSESNLHKRFWEEGINSEVFTK